MGNKTDEVWLLVAVEGYTTLYSAGNEFKINKKGQLVLIGVGGPHSSGELYFIVKRPDEKVTTTLAVYSESITVNMQGSFRKQAAEYFKDCPELVKRIKNKEFKVLDCGELVMEYNKLKDKTM